MTFSFANAFSRGWRLLRSRYLALLGASAVFLLVLVVADAVQSAIDSPLLDLLVAVFLFGPFIAGLQLLALLHLRAAARDESHADSFDDSPDDRPTLRILLAGFSRLSRYWPLVAINAVLALALVVCALLAVGAWAMDGGGAVGAIIALAIMLGYAVLCVRMFFAPLLCIDPRRRFGVKASLVESWRLTGACFWTLLGVLLVGGLIVVVTAVLLLLPLIFFGFPFVIAVIAAAYQSIAGEVDAAPPALDEDLLA